MSEKYWDEKYAEIAKCFFNGRNACQKPVAFKNFLKQIALDQRDACGMVLNKCLAKTIQMYDNDGRKTTGIVISVTDAIAVVHTAEIEEV